MKPVIFGLSGPVLTDQEAGFFREADPAGYILFGRNIESRNQVRALTDSLRTLHGRDDVPILIDQEGGRVSRLKPPVWPEFPPGAIFGRLYDIAPISALEAAYNNAEAIALTLAEIGINVDCLPLLDVHGPDTHDAIGDRSFGDSPAMVAALGRAFIDGLRAGGVVGVVKHMPGQGRAQVDSHHHLPRVDASAEELERDLAPFRTLNHAPMGMTGHIIFSAWDDNECATMSPDIISKIIRGQIGFDGFLMSDDLDMKALSGNVADRARDCVMAGCDVALNCWGRFDEMVAIVQKLPDIRPESRGRLNRAMATIEGKVDPARIAELTAKRDALLAITA